MRKIHFLLAFLFISLPFVKAQKKTLTIEQAILGAYSEFYPAYLSNLEWQGYSDYFTYVRNDTIYRQHAKKTEETAILSLKDLSKILEGQGIELKHVPHYNWEKENILALKIKNKFLRIDIKNKKLINYIIINKNGFSPDLSPNNKYVAYCIDNGLYIANGKSDKKEIASSNNKSIVYGQSVHRSEFGIHKGTFWSPNGELLAFYKKDESMVSNYPLMDVTQRVAKSENIKYPMAGMKSHHVTLGVYDVKAHKTIYIKTGEPKEQYLTNIAWAPDSKSIYIAILNRAQNHMKLNCYSVETGEFEKTLFEEKHAKYVEPQNPISFLPSDPSKFIWQSRRDGFNHLYLYDKSGKLLKQLTKGNWEVTEIVGLGKKDKDLYFVATAKNGMERHLHKVNLNNRTISKLSKVEGVHFAKLSPNGKYLLDTYSSLHVPRKVDILSSNGKLIRNILTAPNPYKNIKLGKTELGELKTKDGKTTLNYRITKPIDFDPSKKYPVIVYVYGGPHAQLVTNRWLGGSRMWQHYMAGKGYIAFTLDNRGSANRGLDFENVIHRKLGVAELEDQMQGIEYLKSLPFVDSERIGVHGWSYGGFMTTSLMLKQPNTFKVGVAGGPVIDWKYYEIMYGERYMDTPEENPDGYKEADLKNHIKNLKGRLLIIHGAIDPTVVWQHSLHFVRECVKNNVLIDYFPYPRHPHNVRGKDRVHLMRKVSLYFEDYL